MKMMENFLIKMKTNQVTNVCKVNTIKAKYFDEAIPRSGSSFVYVFLQGDTIELKICL